MPANRTRVATRIIGTGVGIGFAGLGLVAMFGTDESIDVETSQRVFWYGVTMVIAGTAAVAVSWLVRDLGDIWCRPPARRDRKNL